MGTKQSYIQSLGSLQLLAIIMVVIGHGWVKGNEFMNSVGVSFCFVYSGYFTAMRHPFGGDYGLRDHCRFMWDKLARLYPLHVLAIVLNVVVMLLTGMTTGVSLKVLAAHFTLLSPWIPDQAYYFGYNPVAWFICVLFFLYLMAPLVVRLLRKMNVSFQVILVIALLALEFGCGYVKEMGSDKALLNGYHLYQFPPIRLLDFATGIVLFNLTQTLPWKRLKDKLTASTATLIEVGAIAAFIVLFIVGWWWLHPHCFRAFCTSAPAIVVLFGSFVLTSNCGGAISQALSIKPLAFLSRLGAEIYLLQFSVYFALLPFCKLTGIIDKPIIQIPLVLITLCIVAWIVRQAWVSPLNRLLRKPEKRISE
ncbi:MAG: acyltransferase [Muribaculaceae bacterium]|nr:acyltransferase [Muribaculaceae bacterium]